MKVSEISHTEDKHCIVSFIYEFFLSQTYRNTEQNGGYPGLGWGGGWRDAGENFSYKISKFRGPNGTAW